MLFFDKRPPRADRKPNTKTLWICDFRTNVHFMLKKKPLDKKDLQDFVACLKRDKPGLDIFWLKDESLDDVDSLPAPDVTAAEIVENLQAALEAFQSVADELAVKT